MKYYDHDFHRIDSHIVRFTVLNGPCKGTIDLKIDAGIHTGSRAMHVAAALLEKMFYKYCETGAWSSVGISEYYTYPGDNIVVCGSLLGRNFAEAEYLNDTCHFEYDEQTKTVRCALLDENGELSSWVCVDNDRDPQEGFLDYIVGIEIIGYEEREWNDEEDD